ncbi:hypothetical protein PSQ89_05795 [Pediococcus pentosaceus]|uniref:hypothetical protein n=1 Tax=Pediococcus pentosaceus TaxID=1255 RepID=UPI00235E9A55|nr:hypothetical protein [Pediococcus pentosaceus]MDD1389725.1 hypothetical protein [Pediococcus pentosaceus]
MIQASINIGSIFKPLPFGGGFFILVDKIGQNCNLVEKTVIPPVFLNVLQYWLLLGMCLHFSVKGVEVNM